MLHATMRTRTPPLGAAALPTTAPIPGPVDPRAWAFAMAQGAALCRL